MSAAEEREIEDARYRLEQAARHYVRVMLENRERFGGMSPVQAVTHPAGLAAMLRVKHATEALVEAVAELDYLLPASGVGDA